MAHELDASTIPPKGVESVCHLDVPLGGGDDDHLMVFSGIAIPELDSSEEEDDEIDDMRVTLGPWFGDPFPSYTAVTGLANIGNDDSDSRFVTDHVRLEVAGGKLVLVSKITVHGEEVGSRSFVLRDGAYPSEGRLDLRHDPGLPGYCDSHRPPAFTEYAFARGEGGRRVHIGPHGSGSPDGWRRPRQWDSTEASRD